MFGAAKPDSNNSQLIHQMTAKKAAFEHAWER